MVALLEQPLLLITLLALSLSNAVALPMVALAYLRNRHSGRRLRKPSSGNPAEAAATRQLQALGFEVPDCDDCETVKQLNVRMEKLETTLNEQGEQIAKVSESLARQEKWTGHIQRTTEAQEKQLGEINGQTKTILELMGKGF